MSTHPLISIIIPCYNQGQYLEEAVNSVFAQSYPNLEAIVVNDGSTDDSEAVGRRLQKKYPGLTYFSQPNAGVCVACNAALEKATGEFLIRLDADDILPPTYVESLYKALVASPPTVAFAYCDAHLFGATEAILHAGSFSLTRLAQENFIHVSALVRMKAARESGYYKPEMRYSLEDWDLWLTLAEAGYRGVYCPDTFLYYRQKEGGGRNTLSSQQYREMRQVVYRQHASLYKRPSIWLAVQWWRVLKRLERWGLRQKPV